MIRSISEVRTVFFMRDNIEQNEIEKSGLHSRDAFDGHAIISFAPLTATSLNTPENHIHPQQSTLSLALFLLSKSAELQLRGLSWVVRGFFKNFLLAQKNPVFLAHIADLAILDMPAFLFIMRGLQGLPPLVSRVAKQDPDKTKVGLIFRNTAIYFFTTHLFIGLLFLNARAILEATSQPEGAINISREFFLYMLISYFFDGFYRLMARMTIGLNDTRTPTLADMCESVMDVVALDIFLNGRFGISEMGESAYPRAHLLSSTVTSLSYAVFFFSAKRFRPYQFLNFEKIFSKEIFSKVVAHCLPSGLSGVMTQLSQSVTTSFCAQSENSVDALLADSAAKTYGALLTTLTAGINTISAKEIGGHKKDDHALRRQLGYAAYLANTIETVGLVGFFAIVHAPYTEWMLGDAASASARLLTTQFLIIRTARELFCNSLATAGTSALLGFEDTTYATTCNFIFVLLLHTILTIAASSNVVAMYAMQIIGYFATNVAIFHRYYYHDDLDNNPIQSRVNHAGYTILNGVKKTSDAAIGLLSWLQKTPGKMLSVFDGSFEIVIEPVVNGRAA